MSSKRVLIIVLAVSVLLLAGSAHALPPDQVASPAGVTIPYPGRLADPAGQPVADGEYDFTFTLYDAETGGNALWSETQKGVAVQSGSFATVLGQVNKIPADLAKGQGWLEVAVRGPGETSFTFLSPRQRLSSAPATAASASSASSCAHDHYGENWVGAAGQGFTVQTTAVNGTAIAGVANAGTNAWGVEGVSDNGLAVLGTSTNGVGVYGQCTNGDGVSGMSGAPTKSGVFGYNGGGGYGVAGRSPNGWGLEADGKDGGGDQLGDLKLDGDWGEIFTFGNYLALYSNRNIRMQLDADKNDTGEKFEIFGGWTGEQFTPRFSVDELGNVVVGQNLDVMGNMIAHGGKPAAVETAHYGQRLLYAVESTEVWFEDLGSASLVKGEAVVTFDPIFAETVNLEEDYHVSLTALCQEPVLLFVTRKDAQGFTVRGVALDGQPSSCAFDYRVDAKRLGYEDVRLPPYSESAAAASPEVGR